MQIRHTRARACVFSARFRQTAKNRPGGPGGAATAPPAGSGAEPQELAKFGHSLGCFLKQKCSLLHHQGGPLGGRPTPYHPELLWDATSLTHQVGGAHQVAAVTAHITSLASLQSITCLPLGLSHSAAAQLHIHTSAGELPYTPRAANVDSCYMSPYSDISCLPIVVLWAHHGHDHGVLWWCMQLVPKTLYSSCGTCWCNRQGHATSGTWCFSFWRKTLLARLNSARKAEFRQNGAPCGTNVYSQQRPAPHMTRSFHIQHGAASTSPEMQASV